MSSRNWTCPFCNRAQTVVGRQADTGRIIFNLAEHKYGKVSVAAMATACANPDCQEVTVSATVSAGSTDQFSNWVLKEPLSHHRLRPRGSAKPQPDYIPAPIREDYAEACLVADVSPKAAATLARRCLQGMIRDFCGISKKTLFAEITALRDAVDKGEAPPGVTVESVEAIDHVRSIGNIGAHMESDINLIVGVDAGEVAALTELIEMLFAEWYVSRNVRGQRLARLKAIAESKAAAKSAGHGDPSVATEPDEA